MKILTLLFLITLSVCSGGCGSVSDVKSSDDIDNPNGNCGKSCIRNPENEIASSLSTSSTIKNKFYYETFEISAQAGDIITAHLNSEDFQTQLQLVFSSVVIAEASQEQASYIYPGEIPYWEAEMINKVETSGTYIILVSTVEPNTIGEFTLDWSIGKKEKSTCESVDCNTVI